MIERQQPNVRKHLFFSLLFHILILLALITSFNYNYKIAVLEQSEKNEQVINAMVMDAPPQKIIDRTPKPPEPQPVAPPIPKPPDAVQPMTEPVKDTQAIVIPDKKLQKLKEQQLLADIKKLADEQKKLKQKAVESAFADEMKELKTKSITQQLQQEKKQMAGVRSKQSKEQLKGEIDKYKALIRQAISAHWFLPPNTDKRLYAVLLVRVVPGGAVLDVQIVKSSGSAAFDRSIITAVYNTSPLPVPSKPEEFATFKQFYLGAKPELISANDSWMG